MLELSVLDFLFAKSCLFEFVFVDGSSFHVCCLFEIRLRFVWPACEFHVGLWFRNCKVRPPGYVSCLLFRLSIGFGGGVIIIINYRHIIDYRYKTGVSKPSYNLGAPPCMN